MIEISVLLLEKAGGDFGSVVVNSLFGGEEFTINYLAVGDTTNG
jgi:hypothetical protein